MTEDLWEVAWARARTGNHTLLINPGTTPSAPSDIKLLSVSCCSDITTGGPLGEAIGRLEALLGEVRMPPAGARRHLAEEMRSRLVGEFSMHSVEAMLVEACNRFADWSDGHGALLLEGLDSADAATLETLTAILRHPGWLRLPLILTLRAAPAKGAVAMLVEELRTRHGEGAVMQRAAPVSQATVPFDWMSLEPGLLRIVRAGAVLGGDFEAELAAALLGEPMAVVLEGLQRAADGGAPLADRGEGRFSLPADAVEALKARMLPSLLAFWHEQLGELLSGSRRDAPVPVGTAGRPGPAQESEEREASSTSMDDNEAASPEETIIASAPSLDRFAELFEPATHAPEAERPFDEPVRDTAESKSASTTPTPSITPPPDPETQEAESGWREDQARAAAHLQAAGRTEVAAARYLNAVREVFARGDARRAYLLAQEALRLLEQLPGSAQRALLRAKLLLEMGRVQWHGAVLGAPFTLRAALESLQAARASLPDAAPRKVAGELATLTAGVCYDLGDLPSLELALQELTTVSRQLLEAGDATLAARLLNDQAAVYVRLGDPVRATHLLSRSRELFGGLLRENPDEPSILEELAQTEHLLARLPLHAQLRPGRESDAYAVCLDHAAAAERAYRGLDMRRELARIWETMGRLELGRERLEPARQRLSAALQLQRESGDVTGLARSTAALADVYVKADRPDEAVGLLAESVTLNFEKGSPIGLAFNRRAFQMLIDAVRRMRRPPTERLQEMLAELERRLAEAEAVLGKLTLPGDLSADG